MKTKLSLLIALTVLAGMLSGCGGSELAPVRDEAALTESLPEQLSQVVIDGAPADCTVAHLAVVDRDTDTLRQTDRVTCAVELAGDSVDVQYTCTLFYTYTQNGGWGLDDWSLSSISAVEFSDAYLEEVFSAANLNTLSQQGYDEVTIADTQWDGAALSLTQTYDIASNSGLLGTSGQVVISGQLTQADSQGLSFTWNSSANTDGIFRYALLQDTTWLVSGSSDGESVAMALYIQEFNLDDGELSLSYSTLDSRVSSVTTSSGVSGGYTERQFYASREYYYGIYEDWDDYLAHNGGSTSVTRTRQSSDYSGSWSADQDGTVSFQLEDDDDVWDFFFAEDRQWARLNGSYLGELSQQTLPDSGQVGELLNSETDEDDDDDITINYTTQTSSKSYKSSDGTTIYTQSMSYPVFSGADMAADLNTEIQTAIARFINQNPYGTSESQMDRIQSSDTYGGNFPLRDSLNITVTFNENGYLSILWETVSHDGAETTYSYDSDIYDLSRQRSCTYATFLDLGSYRLSELLTTYLGDRMTWDAYDSSSYVDATVFSQEGMDFYLVPDDTQEAIVVTIPWSDENWYNSPRPAEDTDTGTDADAADDAGDIWNNG